MTHNIFHVFRSIESPFSGLARRHFSAKNTAHTRDRHTYGRSTTPHTPVRAASTSFWICPHGFLFAFSSPLRLFSLLIDGREEAKQTMAFPSTYDEYISKLEDIGEAILQWSDPDKLFSGHTEVRSLQCTMNSNMYRKCPMNPSFFLTRRFLNLLHSLRDGC
jgi:hypothetical protein